MSSIQGEELKSGRRRRSRAQWRRVIRAQSASELGQKDYCTRHGISYSTFCRWKRELGTDQVAALPSPTVDFVELAPSVASVAAGWEVELELGEGLTLRLRRSCCCWQSRKCGYGCTANRSICAKPMTASLP